MAWHNIACFEDLLRPGTIFPEAFYDWAREPIRQGAGIDIASSPRAGKRHNFLPSLDIGQFLLLVEAYGRSLEWERHYFSVPAEAGEYLMRNVPPGTLLIAMELPPWLASLCARHELPFIDLRVSPLRFGRDLYVAMATNHRATFERMREFAVPSDECRLEASVMAASIRCHERRLELAGRHDFALGNCLVYIGQVWNDAAIIAPDGSFLRCEAYADRLRALDRGHRLLYKPHPYAGDFADVERLSLSRLFGREPEIYRQNVYQVLSSPDDVELVALSSGVMQEAAYFGKTGHMMHRPFCPLAEDADGFDSGKYLQVRFQDFLAPAFWHAVLAPERRPPAVRRVPPVQPNLFRESLDQWWDYSKFLVWERSFWIEAFVQSGGGALQHRVAELERRLDEQGTP